MLIIGGDFNQVIDPRCDRSHHPDSSQAFSSSSGSSRFSDLASQYGLKDVWRLRNVNTVDYTYYSPRHNVFSRTDYFLVDSASADLVLSCDIGPMLWTDQTWLECRLCLSSQRTMHKTWSFDRNILTTERWRSWWWRPLKTISGTIILIC